MKRTFSIILILLFQFSLVFADSLPQPEKIFSITRITKSFDYYVEQAHLWKLETQKEVRNADTWYNYFLAARYANRLSDGMNPFNLKSIVEKIPNAIPNTAEYFYINYIFKGRGPDNFDLLLKAHELAPKNPAILHDMVTLRVANGEQEQVRQLLKTWYDSNEMPTGLYKWNYNMLMSVEPNAILITWGDNDTYPAWILQQVKNVRPDVVVLNAWMLAGYEDYQKRVFEKFDIPAMRQKKADFPDHAAFFEFCTDYVMHNSQRPVYIAAALPQNIKGNHHEYLYSTGLAFKYSKEDFDNVAVMKNNFENKFLKDYLFIDLENDISQGVVNTANVNYIPPFLRLYRHYKESGEEARADQLKVLIKNIAEKGGKLDQVLPYLGDLKYPSNNIESILDVKSMDRGYVKIHENLYAAETELTNAQYENFLMDLLKNKDFEKLEVAKTSKTNWRNHLSDNHKGQPDHVIFEHAHPEAAEAPIQNISHEGAKLYCDWMTMIYNNSNHKKKLYKKVLFRLPLESEWTMAAKGGHLANYPWGGFYFKNAKGCYLANYDVANEEPCTDCKVQYLSNDGGFFPVKADAYYPNDYGCYNMSGNVAEMIQTPGVAMGGSWADKPENAQVDSKQIYKERSPKVGFRVFMEVLEYKN